ncbi:MAG: 5'-nucleotidase C-terminal domain-containing protein [Prevotellaceae bacterium]|nr:5'-nucleotidase C-terminal domain-containing protein [Prevotellaceae bacterium]
MMKTSLSALLLAGAFASAYAQNYEPTKVRAHRIEVTSVLDKHPDTDLTDFLAPYKAGVDSLMAPLLGVSSATMPVNRPESPLSNWIADVLRSESTRYGKMADMGLCNMGGIRSAMPAGNVTVGDIMEIAPFENRFCLLTLKGDALLQLFEQMAHSYGEGISGAQLDISSDGKLLSATIGGKVVNPKAKYTIATIDYLAEGNDGLLALKDAVKKEVKPDFVRDVYMEYIRREHAAGRPLTAAIEGRVTVEGKRADELDAETDNAAREKQLTIVHTSDTHSCILPFNPNSTDVARANKGGYLRRKVLIDNLREDNPELLLVDCGDFSQGSAYYNLYKGEVEVQLMNKMRYDAATIGNHEFDFGVENMARIFRMATFPIICCNYDFGTTPLRDLVKPYTIIYKNGLKIGLIGVCAQLEGLVSSQNCEGITYLNPIDCANPIAERLKNEEHCDLVFVLSHLGWTPNLNGAMNDQEFIAGMRNIDAVFGGHSHLYFADPAYVRTADGKDIPCDHQGKNAQFIGIMQFDLRQK